MTEQVYNPGSGFRQGSHFGNRPAPGNGGSTGHKGMDYPAENGTPIPAAADGIVVNSYNSASYGNVVVLKHEIRGETIYTAYAHQIEPSHLHAGDLVKQGESVGKVGSTGHSTGHHLHFEIIKSEPNPLSADNRLVVGHHVYNPSEFKFPQTQVQTNNSTQDYHSTYDIKSEAKPVELTHPELSKTAQTLITDATTHTKQWVSDNNREWNEQFNQAAHSVAHAAHKEGLTGINLFLVKDGEIHFAQRNHWGTNVASVDAKIASNTDVNSNLQAMADIDQTRAHSHRQAQEQSLTQSRGLSI